MRCMKMVESAPVWARNVVERVSIAVSFTAFAVSNVTLFHTIGSASLQRVS